VSLFSPILKLNIAGKRQLGDRFRAERKELQSLFHSSSSENDKGKFPGEALKQRSARNAEAIQKLQSLESAGNLSVDIPDLLSSYAHMHVNRLIRSAQRAHELVLYDFLFQLYESQLARNTS